jgi:hypothetical protein
MTRKQAKEFINQQTTKQVQAQLLIGRYSAIPKMDVNCWQIKTEFSEDKKVVMNILKERKFADWSLKTDFNACTKDKEPSSDYLSAIFIQPNKLIEIRCDYDQDWEAKPPTILDKTPLCQGEVDQWTSKGWRTIRVIKTKKPAYVKEWSIGKE